MKRPNRNLQTRGSRASAQRCADFPGQDAAKDYVFSLIQRGELLLAQPLREGMKAALERMGFEQVRIDHEKIHDIFLLRARIGPNVDCRSVGSARTLLRRMVRQVG